MKESLKFRFDVHALNFQCLNIVLLLTLCLSLLMSNQFLAQSENKINAVSLFSGARLTKYPKSFTLSSSTGLVKNFSPEALIDGSQDKIWCSAEAKAAPFIFEIELIETFMISEFEFSNMVENYPGICAKDFFIEVSPVKETPQYTKVLSAKLDERGITKFTIDPIETRKIRLTIKSNYGHRTFTELGEFKAFGVPKMGNIQTIDIQGRWASNWGDLNFVQNGTLVEGNYVFNNGLIRFGGIQRNRVTYTWIEDVIGRKGNTLMFLNEEGNELVGIWCYDNDWTNYGFWVLSRDERNPFQAYVEVVVEPEKFLEEMQGISTQNSVVQQMETELIQMGKLVVYGINFKFNSAEILPESYGVLKQIYEVLLKNEGIQIRIEGHTDNIGADEYNNRLSLQRAEAVKQFFIEMGIGADRIVTSGKGKTVPVADNDTEMGRSLNRRVEIHLLE
jgi:outer membrane protein OmpA-like peptidoglycan-associated protein